ncbi:MAG: hypothetical protein DRN01_07325 [Thermoplasmata archaeon]|nr:MAG: hypothetical protein DRN01_07325 [Thermoplasmata archaeon]
MNAKKSWREKLFDSKGLPKIVEIPERMTKKWGNGSMVVPAPREVDEIMKQVPEGKLVTINEVRKRIAEKHGVNTCCPLTTGIFVWVAAHAAEEDRAEGKKDFTPYWRTLKNGGVINEKYPGGVENVKRLLEKEGHVVVKKGKRFVVKDYEKALFIL